MNPGLLTATNNINSDPTKIWYGVVEATTDPDPALGRVKVRIFGYHTDDVKILPVDDLPWAVVMRPNSTPESSGSLKAGNIVMGVFMDGEDCQQPLVLGTLYTKLKSVGAVFGTQEAYDNPGSPHRIENPNPGPQETTESGSQAQSSQQPANAANAAASGGQVTTAAISLAKVEGNQTKKVEDSVKGLGAAVDACVAYTLGGITLTQDIGKDQDTLPVSRTSGIPPRGWIVIDGEEMCYEGYNQNHLINVKRGKKYNTNGGTTNPAEHKKGAAVTFHPESDVVTQKKPDGTRAAFPMFSKFSNKIVDIQEEISKVLNDVKNVVTGALNKVKGWLLNLQSEIIAKITLIFKSPIPMTLKVIADALMMLLKAIACLFSNSMINSIVQMVAGGLQQTITSLVQELISKATSLLDFVSQCVSSIFDSIFSLVESISTLSSAINAVASAFGAAGNLSKVTSVAGIIQLLANLLGMVLCGDATDEPYEGYKPQNGMTANGCSDEPPKVVYNSANIDCPDIFANIDTAVRNLMAPVTELNRIIDYGGGIVHQFDSTPDFVRSHMELGNGNAIVATKKGIRITTSGSKEEVIIENNVVKVKGNYVLDVTGDISISCSGDYKVNCREYHVVNNGFRKEESIGEAELLYKDSVHIKPINQFLVTGAKVGLTSSAGTEFAGGHLTSLVSEINWASLGGQHHMQLFKTKTTGVSDNTVTGVTENQAVGGAKSTTVAGAKTAQTGGVNNETNGAVKQSTTGAASNETVSAAKTQQSASKVEATGAHSRSCAAKMETKAATMEAQAVKAKASGPSVHTTGGPNVQV